MAQSSARTIGDYLADLPPEWREPIATVRQAVLAHMPPGYEEVMQFGMIGYVIPFERYPVTYNKQAL